MAIRFVYFDLGNVLVRFDIHRLFDNVKAITGTEPPEVRKAIFADGLQDRLERGTITERQFHEQFCQRIGVEVPFDLLAHAARDMFYANAEMLPVLTSLAVAGFPCGVLSNTSALHFEHCCYDKIAYLERICRTRVVSYEVGAMKPEPAIYHAAIEKSGVAPEEIFFMDDRQENVDGAIACGMDAVCFTSAAQIIQEMRLRRLPLIC